MIQTVILDLDGPILDGQFRHYACYRNILAEHCYAPVDLESYWQMKRERVDRRHQLAASDAEDIYADYIKSWLELIESPEMLALDRIQRGAKEKLREWRDLGVRLALVTQRRHPERLHSQLTKLGLAPLFDHILVSEHSQGGVGKAARIRNTLPDLVPTGCLWIGDTEVDIEAARSFGCPVWALTCGLRTESYLASLQPDFIGHDVTNVDFEALS